MRNKPALADILRSQGNIVAEVATIDDAEHIARETGADLIIFESTDDKIYGLKPRDCQLIKMLFKRPGFVC